MLFTFAQTVKDNKPESFFSFVRVCTGFPPSPPFSFTPSPSICVSQQPHDCRPPTVLRTSATEIHSPTFTSVNWTNIWGPSLHWQALDVISCKHDSLLIISDVFKLKIASIHENSRGNLSEVRKRAQLFWQLLKYLRVLHQTVEHFKYNPLPKKR